MANWYVRSAGGDTFNPNSYTVVGATPPPCPGANRFICAVFADDNGFGKPVLSAALQGQMEAAITNNADQTNVRIRLTF